MDPFKINFGPIEGHDIYSNDNPALFLFTMHKFNFVSLSWIFDNPYYLWHKWSAEAAWWCGEAAEDEETASPLKNTPVMWAA